MEAPPPYMQPRKKSNTGLIIGLVVGGVLLCCVGPVLLLGLGGLWIFNKAKPMLDCGSTFAVARDAMVEYSKAHDGKLPNTATWMDDIRPYYKKLAADVAPFKPMPADAVWGCDDGSGGRTGMAFNSDVAGKPQKDLGREDVVLFEIRSATANAAQKYAKLNYADSPKIFNDHRGWMVAYIEGPPGFRDRHDRFIPFETRGQNR